MRHLLIAAAAVTCLLLPTPVDAAQPADAHSKQGGSPKCLKSAKKVATKKLRTPGGVYYGKAVITVSTQQQGDYSYVVCATTEVAKRYRNHQTIVRQRFSEYNEDGDHLGELRYDAYADKNGPLKYSSSFVPEGSRYVFRAKIEGPRTAAGKVTYRVPR